MYLVTPLFVVMQPSLCGETHSQFTFLDFSKPCFNSLDICKNMSVDEPPSFYIELSYKKNTICNDLWKIHVTIIIRYDWSAI